VPHICALFADVGRDSPTSANIRQIWGTRLEERPLSEGQRAFRDLDEGKVAAAKIVLRP